MNNQLQDPLIQSNPFDDDMTKRINLMKEEVNNKKDGKKKKKKKGSFWEKAFNKGKLKKPNRTAVVFLRNNGRAETMEVESRHGFFNIHGRTYHEDLACMYRMKDGTPFAMIPEWSLIPYGTKIWHEKSMLEKFAELQDHTIKGIRHAELVKMGEKDKKPLNAKAWIGLGILVIVGYVVITQYI